MGSLLLLYHVKKILQRNTSGNLITILDLRNVQLSQRSEVRKSVCNYHNENQVHVSALTKNKVKFKKPLSKKKS